jgi:Tannase-like family of unknown function (DUF6351)
MSPSLGYAVASSTLNVLDNNCSTIISAEAAMMVKEHFIDTYGPVQFTIGWGGSGGAIQQYEIADSYPGILDGIIPSVSFPDPITTGAPVTDCRMLDSFFAGPGSTLRLRRRSRSPATTTTRPVSRGISPSPTGLLPPAAATRLSRSPTSGTR